MIMSIEIFGDYGLNATMLFLLGIILGFFVFGIFYLVLIWKTNDENQVVKPDRQVSKEEIVSIIRKSHNKIDNYSREQSLAFDKTKQVSGNLINVTKELPVEIAKAFYPTSKNPLQQMTIDELLMTNREIIKDAKFIINNLDESVIKDINEIIKHANNITSGFGYKLSGTLNISNLTIGDFTNIKSYMAKTIKFEKIENADKEGILKTITKVVQNKGLIKDEIAEISDICLRYGVDIRAEVKKIGEGFREELSQATEGGKLKAIGSAIKSAVTTKPSQTIAKVKTTVIESTKKVIFLSADEILSSQLANLYKDLITMVGIEVYAIYSKQLFVGKSIDKIGIQELLHEDNELQTEVKLTLKKQLAVS